MAQSGWKNPEGELGWERGVENEKGAAGWGGGAASAWVQRPSYSVPEEPTLCSCPGAWGPGGLDWAGLVSWQWRGFSNQTWQEASSVPGAHPLLPWLPPP